MAEIQWRIYYADGTTWDDRDGSWDDAPLDGVVAVAVRDPDYGKLVLNGSNFYYSQDGGAPLDKALTNDIGPQLRARCRWLKHGVGVPREQWQAILVAATKDPDFPPSNAPRRRSTDGERDR